MSSSTKLLHCLNTFFFIILNVIYTTQQSHIYSYRSEINLKTTWEFDGHEGNLHELVSKKNTSVQTRKARNFPHFHILKSYCVN